MIRIEDLTVQFGGVKPLDGVTVEFPVGTCGLIGPNGAGKTTFFNVLSGFVNPRGGKVVAFDQDLFAMPHYRRARWGLRRTVQTEQAIEELSLDDNVAMVHEHWGENRKQRREDVLGALGFVGLDHLDPRVKVGVLDARDRRLVEIARAVVGRPRLVLLDEPAAGLPDGETEHHAGVIRRIPENMGAVVIRVDHDMSLVQYTCSITAVLDCGRLIASGPTAEVLRDEHVIKAYLGTEEEL
jgi:ABC-type branched-subunit amino acid transport system ATPase component